MRKITRQGHELPLTKNTVVHKCDVLEVAGVILTLTPHIIGLIFGRLVLKMNPVLLFGALTGAGTSTATLNALKEEANSPMPVLGYTVPFAFGNVLLTIWGTVLVNVM